MAHHLIGDALPPRLLDMTQPPGELWLHGALTLARPAVALVGTRHPTPAALAWTAEAAAELARLDVIVISGGALGIDAAAHRGALAAGGRTLVVAPAGWDRPYPAEHAELFREVVARGGGYLALVAPDVRARRGAFHRRNGVLVALADVTVVVEAGLKSGARNAAGQARRIGRPVMAVGYPPWCPAGAGNVLELQLGARAVGGVSDLVAALARAGHPGLRPPTATPQLELPGLAPAGADPAVDRVLRAVGEGVRTVDELVAVTGESVPRLRRAILDLVLAGLLREHPAGGLELSTAWND